MSDLISREDAITAIDRLLIVVGDRHENDYEYGWNCGIDCAADVVGELPSAEANWIPCSERLPQCGIGMHYLVTLKDGHCFKDDVYEAFFDKNGWHMGYNELADDDVIAWMPLPTPYREEGE